ncbi:MAG: efflux RND transporter periplasmic adaptor subunit [Coprococcus sp.]
MYKLKKVKTSAVIALSGALIVSLCGCGKISAKDSAPKINLEEYSKVEYDTVAVEQGDIASTVELTLKPDDYESKNYSIEQSDYEVEKVNVKKGDKVSKGDVMISFKAEEVQNTIDSYVEQKAENEMLIDHYTKLMAISSEEDYTEEIASLREDIEIADLYIEEQNERMKDYQVIAERDGTVTYVDDNLQYEDTKVLAGATLVTLVSGSSDYTATTDDDFEFKVGEIYEAEFQIATYEMKLAKCDKYTDSATDKVMQKLIFEPTMDMSGVTESDELNMTIDKPIISNVTYVDKNAVFEGTDENYYVYVVNEDGYRKAVKVTIGDEVDDYIIIKDGLKAGEQVTLN